MYPAASPEADPAFVLPEEKRLAHVGAGLSPSEVADWLAHRVAREPANLRNHVQRINHHLERNEAAAVSGALADLFLVLGDKGLPLRRMMLARCRGVLQEAVHGWFAAHVEAGLQPHSPLPDACPAILWSGALGSTRLVDLQRQPAAAAPAAGHTLLDAVSEMILEGDFSGAVDALVAGLIHSPTDTSLQRELHKLLGHLGDARLAQDCAARLARYGVPLAFPNPSQ